MSTSGPADYRGHRRRGKGKPTCRPLELCATLQVPIASPRDAVPREGLGTGIVLCRGCCRRFVAGFGDDPGASGVVCRVVLRGEDDAKDHDGENNNDEPDKGSPAETRPVRETIAVPVKSRPVDVPQLALVGGTLRLTGLVVHFSRRWRQRRVLRLALRPEQGITNRGGVVYRIRRAEERTRRAKRNERPAYVGMIGCCRTVVGK